MAGESDTIFDVAVIGGGLAGLTAAHHAALRGLSVVSFDEGGHMGGLVMNIGAVDGYPAMGPVSGVEIAAAQLEAIVDLGVVVMPESVGALSVEGDTKVISSDSGAYRARHAIVASGARLKWLGVPGEEALFGRGVSQCADCDGGFFMDQKVVVVGGGDSALQEALHLAGYAREILIVSHGDRLRARQAYVDRIGADPKFAVRLDTEVTEILGSEGVEGVRMREVTTGSAEEVACDGVFVFVGLEPNAGFLPDTVARDAGGHVVVDTGSRTTVPGVYAVGAVRAGFSGLLAAAADEAATVVANLPA